MNKLFALQFSPILMAIGGSNIKTSVSGSSSLDGINTFLKNCGTAVGGVLIALAALKMIIALADENVAERQKATMLLGVGIVFVSISAVLTSLIGTGISSSSDYRTVAGNIVMLIGNLASYAGIAMVVFGIFSYILAVSQEDASQQSKATNSLLVAIGFLSLSSICSTFKGYITANVSSGRSYLVTIIEFIAKIATYGGACLAVMCVFKYIMALREEDAKARHEAIKLLLVAIALLSFKQVLRTMHVL